MKSWSRVLFFMAFLLLLPHADWASGSWSYGITTTDTPGTIDSNGTTARVDTAANEILLPSTLSPGLVSFLADGGTGYAVLTTTGVKEFEFDGTQMVQNTIASVTGLTNPLALAASVPYPDVVVATSSGVKHYAFTGAGMTENPALGVAGLTNAVSVGTGQEGGMLSALTMDGQVKRYLFDGSAMTEAPVLEPAGPFTNPIALAEGGGYDLVLLENDRVRWFSFDGSGMVQNPALAVTGLANPVAFAVDSGTEIAVVDGTQVKHYTFDGSGMTYNAALSVTSGLTSPREVAIKPESYDRIVADGIQVRYYSFDGSQMVYNPSLSVTVADMAQGNGYSSPASAQSQGKDPGVNADRVRVRAYHSLPNGTTVTWYVTADGTNWVTRWRVRGIPSGTVAEITPDNGVSWQQIGDASQVSPAVNRTDLWVDVAPGRSVRWRAVLTTVDQAQTPKVKAQGGVAVVWEADAKPNPPAMTVPGWFYTTTPTFSWIFSDTDPGDSQSAYQVVIRRQSDGALVYDSGKVISNANNFTLPTSQVPNVPGPLWASGAYAFTVQTQVWDQADAASGFSLAYPFKVLAFERPRIAEIVSSPAGQEALDPANPATWIMLAPGITADLLPRVKAGARATLVLESVGPVNTPAASVATFPYGAGKTATVGTATVLNSLGSAVNRWTIPFWTDANLQNTPDGTVVQLQVAGTGTEGGTTTFNLPPYAAGIVKTLGSVYQDWFVVLQGSQN